MKNPNFHLLIATSMLAGASATQAAVVVTTSKFGVNADPGATQPTVSTTDLGQVSGTMSNSGTEGANPGNLVNGTIGNFDGDTNEEVRVNSGTTLTLNLDVSVNTLGYDITSIRTIAGWNEASGGRANQAYSISLTFVDNSTALFIAKQVWESNLSPSQFWTDVVFTESGGGFLVSNTVNVNGGGAVADQGVAATGVKSITWTSFDNANPGNVVVYREFDVFGTATVPEPSVAILGGLGVLALLRRRRC